MSAEIQFSSDFKLFKKDPELQAEAPDTVEIDALPRVWINAAKEGMVIDVNGELCTMTREGLESSLGTWKNGGIRDNHKTPRSGFKIYEDKFESPFLAFLLDEKTAKSLKKSAGGSIDGIALEVKDKKIVKMSGVAYSILEKGMTPSCTPEAGCGIPIAGEVKIADIDTEWNFIRGEYTFDQLGHACAWSDTSKSEDELTKTDYKLAFKAPDGTIVFGGVVAAMAALNGERRNVNIPKQDRKTVYNILKAAYKLFDKKPPELKAAIRAASESEDKGGSKEKMVDEDKGKSVMYSADQVADIKAAAIADITEQLAASHKVEIGEFETAKAAELKTVGDAHAAELVKQHDEVQKQTAMIEALTAKYALSDKAKEQLMGAKTMDDALTLFASLKVEKAEPVVAAEGGKMTGSGVVLGAGKIEGAAPKTVKIEEVGTYNPYTRKYEPTYREDVI